MKRKYKVFLSSTSEGFEDARVRLILQTLKLGHIPAGMELFQAGDTKNLDVIEQEIASSDVFVIVVGSRLGSPITEDDNMTFVMKEYDLAVKYKLPVIPFLPAGSAAQQEPLVRRFAETVQQRPEGGRRIAGFYSNTDDLCARYADALRVEIEHLEESTKGGGWVEGRLLDQLNARVILGDSASTNPFFQRFALRLGTFDKLSKRTAIEADAKALVATYFWEQYMPRLDEKQITNLYFESGSSIAYVSRSFIDYVREEDWFYESKLDTRLHLRTNNILTYLEFLLVEPPWRPMDIQLLPSGPFSQDYGATYGKLKSTRKINSPRSGADRQRLPHDAAREVQALVAILNRSFAKAGLILMTTSGVDIDPASPFPGPHVGSPYNMLLKRSLISVDCPKVMFLDANKWGYPFRFNSCHAVCDTAMPWESVKNQTPLAIALAAQDRKLPGLRASLSDHGFTHQEVGDVPLGEHNVRPIIASNDRFFHCFE
jgi:hypothetical protein